MQTAILKNVLEYINKSIEKNNLTHHFETLINHLNEVINNADNSDYIEKIANKKQEIIEILKNIEPNDWGYSKFNVYKLIEKNSFFGIIGAEKISYIFDKYQANPLLIKNNLVEIQTGIIKFEEQIPYLIQIISPLIEIQTDETNECRTTLYLFFEDKTHIKYITDVEKYTRIWDNILKSFCRLTKNEIQDAIVRNIDKNAIVLNINDGDEILKALSKGTSNIVEIYKKVLRIRQLQYETVSMQLNQEISELFEDEVSITINQATENVVSELMNDYGWTNENDKEEVFLIVQKSLKQILNFIEKGGKIECQLSKDSEDLNEKNKKLILAFDSVKDLQKVIQNIKEQQNLSLENDNINENFN
ncbi:MAG: hypothetical protein A2X12_09605 [Bacteroidetes bacterium GWE2_29_8]|nr:MAG: hypothetical protein A2X12_09605 [Bacteroidetes bacterium GWE2_29_8]OFY20076.1 MAG: hypothetical protein A2X02_06845 [Bacteroidetes bacterium GWF2_29_10]